MQLEWGDQVSKDKINPPHYKNNPIQTFDAITSQFSDAEKIGAIKFNICKYIMRMGKKVETLEGARDDAGKLIPMELKSGDKILFGKWSGTEVKIDGEELLIMKESDILGIIS